MVWCCGAAVLRCAGSWIRFEKKDGEEKKRCLDGGNKGTLV